MLTGGQSRSGGSEISRPKSRFRRDLVSCWTDSGLLKSSWPLGFNLKKGQLCRGLEAVENWQCCSESQVTEDGPVGLNRRHRLTLSQSLCRSKTVLRSRYHLCRC